MNSSFIEKLNNKLNMIELTSKPIVENAMAWQQHGTPDTVIDMMLYMYYENGEFKNNEKILILFNVEIIKQIYFKYRDELIFGNLYFVADSKEKFDIVKRLYPNIHCVLCDQHNIENLIKKIGEFNVKKFDIVYSNPPYNNNIDLRILNSIFESSQNIIFIHPSNFMFSQNVDKFSFLKDTYKNSKYLQSVNLFWGNELFEIKLFVPLCITYWSKNKINEKIKVNDLAFSKTSFECTLEDMSVHGNKFNEMNAFKNNIIQYMKKNNGSILDNNVKANYIGIKHFSVKFSRIRGNVSDKNGIQDDFYSLICQDYNDNLCDETFKIKNDVRNLHKTNMMCLWGFDNNNERMNFINYCKSKVTRFLLSFTKTNANVVIGMPTKIIPWLDFTQEWNDAKLCKEFGISEELWQYIDNFIPDYYDDYKSGFEK